MRFIGQALKAVDDGGWRNLPDEIDPGDRIFFCGLRQRRTGAIAPGYPQGERETLAISPGTCRVNCMWRQWLQGFFRAWLHMAGLYDIMLQMIENR